MLAVASKLDLAILEVAAACSVGGLGNNAVENASHVDSEVGSRRKPKSACRHQTLHQTVMMHAPSDYRRCLTVATLQSNHGIINTESHILIRQLILYKYRTRSNDGRTSFNNGMPFGATSIKSEKRYYHLPPTTISSKEY